MIKYTKFSLSFFYLSPLFLFFTIQCSTTDSTLFLAMAESNLPTTGEELEVKNEFPATGEKKQQGKTWLWWFCTVC